MRRCCSCRQVCQVQAPADRLLPVLEAPCGNLLADLWCEGGGIMRGVLRHKAHVPEAHCEAGCQCCTQGGGLLEVGPLDGDLKDVRLGGGAGFWG